MGKNILTRVPSILFPVQAPTHWLLLVAKRLSGSTMLGSMNFPDADLWICDSTSTSTATFSENQAKEQVIETVIAYLRLATGNDKFTCVKTQTKVAESSLVDSGIAATMNALSIIDGEAFEKEMGEVRCWELRERFLRGVVGSVRFNEQVENGSQGGSVLGAKNGYRRASVEDVDEEEEEEVTFVSSQPRRSEDARPSDSNSPAANKRRLIQKKERRKASSRNSLDCRWLDSLDESQTRKDKHNREGAPVKARSREKRPKGGTGPSESSLDCRWLDDEEEAFDESNDERPSLRKERPMPSPSSSLDCRWLDQEEKRSKAKEKGSKKARLTL